ncbi:peptide chain release factor N(5)-glutamine methyltransferase [Zhouia spongiae]|uniref:peptide chain release factor N(5)-glutamine methyltransferase n=1 Tax=Zhouia spongiae TaxID=2202721 RepID=A0ABY3YKG2_9FLAO|nr:peptide chain release factor N(5)-glutamine methyltransferase [Zhouia spongiae]UNY98240.1 peptide chain release factor N(5)-glutamine methyltransferase [Zhouia spongiae]
MRVKDIQQVFHRELDGLYEAKEVDRFYFMLLEHYFDIRRIDLISEPDRVISKEDETVVFKALSELKLEKPIQYIVGEAYFYGLSFKVNSNTLIPRPETEELVDWIVKDKRAENRPVKILDIGTGSGCIAIALAKNIPCSKVAAMDVSAEALKMAKDNARQHNVDIDFIEADVLELEDLSGCYDVIVSNPPYVRDLEKKEMHDNVLRYEPHSALFVSDAEPLLFYKKIAVLAREHLCVNGALYFEINQYLPDETIKMLENTGFEHNRLKKDFRGNYRMVKSSVHGCVSF